MRLDLEEDYIHKLLGSDCYPEIDPVFNREGIYLDGDKCWVELNGRAFEYDADTFKREVKLMDMLNYTEKQRKALRDIRDQKLATKSQIELLYFIDFAHEVRNTYRHARKHSMRIFNNVQEKLTERV